MESPEKVRGMEEFIDNFRIELRDDELQREEMEEKEMEKEKEGEKKEKEIEKEKEKEKEMEKEKEKEKEKEEEGELPFRVSKPPFSNQQGFTCSCCLSTNDHTVENRIFAVSSPSTDARTGSYCCR